MSERRDFGDLCRVFLMTPDMSGSGQITSTNTDNQLTEENVRCVCLANRIADSMWQCQSCKKWLHRKCVPVSSTDGCICVFCQGQFADALRSYTKARLYDVWPLVQNMESLQVVGEYGKRAIELIEDMRAVMSLVPRFIPTGAPQAAAENRDETESSTD